MKSYRGPCLDCGQYKNQKYTRKRCIACYQKFHRYSPEFKPQKKYIGPCVYCGSMKSTDGIFVRKMCSKCYGRFKPGGDPSYKDTIKYRGPCIVCGSDTPGYKTSFQEKMCSKCYRHYVYRKTNPEPAKKFCIDCGCGVHTISRNSRCSKCHVKWRRKTDPNFRKNERNRMKEYLKTDKGKETQRNHVRRRRAQLAKVESTLTNKEWQDILEKYNHKCVYCGSGEKIEMDHVIPVSKGGPHTKENVVPACRTCNSRKNNKIIM